MSHEEIANIIIPPSIFIPIELLGASLKLPGAALELLGAPLGLRGASLELRAHPPLTLLGASFELLEATLELRGAAQQTNGWTIEVEDVGRTITDRRGMMTRGGGERVDAGLQRQGSVGWGGGKGGYV